MAVKMEGETWHVYKKKIHGFKILMAWQLSTGYRLIGKCIKHLIVQRISLIQTKWDYTTELFQIIVYF
jgi:hypothetical protein